MTHSAAASPTRINAVETTLRSRRDTTHSGFIPTSCPPDANGIRALTVTSAATRLGLALVRRLRLGAERHADVRPGHRLLPGRAALGADHQALGVLVALGRGDPAERATGTREPAARLVHREVRQRRDVAALGPRVPHDRRRGDRHALA